jgi:hypothetical protein
VPENAAETFLAAFFTDFGSFDRLEDFLVAVFQSFLVKSQNEMRAFKVNIIAAYLTFRCSFFTHNRPP